MTRSPRAGAALVAAGMVGGLAACQTQPETDADLADRPNIVFILTDDHAAHAIGAYAGPLAALDPTPTIDRLAREGMRFTNAFVTNAICAPSRAVILTGQHSHLNGVRTNAERFDSTAVTFPKLLREAGYQTAVIGKWHLKSDPTGFDHWEVLPGQGHYYNPDFRTPQGTVRDTGYVTDLITDRALAWLRGGRDPSRPFLLMYQHKAPHRTWEPGPAQLRLYDDVEIPEPPTLFDDYANRSSAARQQEMTVVEHLHLTYDLKIERQGGPGEGGGWMDRSGEQRLARMTEEQRTAWQAAYEPEAEAFAEAGLAGEELTRWKYRRYLEDYLATVASVDANLGRLLGFLEESGLASNTLIVYSSDQGFFLGDHGWYDKRWMYEESLRTPLIVRWPGVVAAGSENSDLVQNLDFAPTFLDAAGVQVPPEMQGRSLAPLLRGETPPDWRDAVYYHYYEYPGAHSVRPHYGVRTDRFKLIHYPDLGEWELFDLARDPHELASVHEHPDYAEVRAALRARLDELRALYAVPADRLEAAVR